MADNKYRLVQFTATVTLRMPWDTAAHPDACAEFWRSQNLEAFTNPDAMNVWEITIPNRARTYNRASDVR